LLISQNPLLYTHVRLVELYDGGGREKARIIRCGAYYDVILATVWSYAVQRWQFGAASGERVWGWDAIRVRFVTIQPRDEVQNQSIKTVDESPRPILSGV